MKRLVKLTISVAVLAWLLIPSSGYAQSDTKIFPGTSCQPFNGTQASALQSFPIFSINVGQENLPVTCPIVGDREALTPGNLFLQALVQSSNNQELVCIAFTMSVFGSFVESVTRTTRSSGQTLFTWNLGLSDVFYANLVCVLPPEGRIFHYVVTEPPV